MNHIRRSGIKSFEAVPKSRLQHGSASVISHNNITKIEEQKNQGCTLTNTVLQQGTPHSLKISRENLTAEDRTMLVDNVKRSLLNTTLPSLDKTAIGNPDKASEIVGYKYNLTTRMLQNLVKEMWKTDHARYSGLNDTTLSSKQDLALHLSNKIPNKSDHLISGTKPLTLFVDVATMETTSNRDVNWQNLVSSNEFNLKELPSKIEANQTTLNDGAPLPCPHKLLTVNNFRWASKLQQGMFYTFAHALTYALQNGGEMEKDLKQPVPMQYVAFNGTSFFFVWYQLNTLKLNQPSDNSSIRNLAWTGEVKLCDRITARIPQTDYYVTYTDSGIARRKNSDVIQDGNDVMMTGFNKEGAQLFTDFLLYPVSSKK